MDGVLVWYLCNLTWARSNVEKAHCCSGLDFELFRWFGSYRYQICWRPLSRSRGAAARGSVLDDLSSWFTGPATWLSLIWYQNLSEVEFAIEQLSTISEGVRGLVPKTLGLPEGIGCEVGTRTSTSRFGKLKLDLEQFTDWDDSKLVSLLLTGHGQSSTRDVWTRVRTSHPYASVVTGRVPALFAIRFETELISSQYCCKTVDRVEWIAPPCILINEVA